MLPLKGVTETDSLLHTVMTRSLKNSDLIRVAYLETFYTAYIRGLWCHDVGSIQRIRQSLKSTMPNASSSSSLSSH